MRRPVGLFLVPFILGTLVLAPAGGARADAPGEGPFEIDKCQTISDPGSYKLVNNLTATPNSDCLVITANSVTIDLAGFSITGSTLYPVVKGTGIMAVDNTRGVAVRNGSISGFGTDVYLAGEGSIVEGLRIVGGQPSLLGIGATGIVKGNTVFGIGLPSPQAGAGVGDWRHGDRNR
jgi:hypothetical protein